MAEPLQKERENLKFRVSGDDTSRPTDDASASDTVSSDGSTTQPSNLEERVTAPVEPQSVAKASSESTSATPSDNASAASVPGDQASSQSAPMPATPSDPDDLIDIITNPHASELEWVSACHQLDKHERRNARKQKKGITITKRAVGIFSAVALAATVGAAAIFHWGPFAPPAINYGPYMNTLQQDIKSHWHPPSSMNSTQVAIHFKVHKNGELSDVGFDRMSRLSDADAAVLKSVIESMPSLPPLPEGAPESVDVQFHFDYNVKGDKSKAPANHAGSGSPTSTQTANQ